MKGRVGLGYRSLGSLWFRSLGVQGLGFLGVREFRASGDSEISR